ncbi:hypothetical protein TNCV_5020861 [Trichonephila clavipes]|nr:hypothetical protein TNCV_5020861 [Trichonephila clavipes]
MTLKSTILHPFWSESSNGRIASIHMTNYSPICPTYLFQSNDLSNWDSCSRNDLESLTGILNSSATEILTIRLRIASYIHQLSAQLACAVAPTIHSLDTKF